MEAVELSSDALEAHGWWMWAAWFPVGFCLLASERYLKGRYWDITHTAHALLGHTVTLITLVQGYQQLKMYDWQVAFGVHNWMAVLFCAFFLIADVSGSVAAGVGRFSLDEPWKA